MNIKIEAFHNNTSIFKGKLLTLPFKESIISQKSMELFGDDDPCVIHQSYVIRVFCEEMAEALDEELNYSQHSHLLDRLDFDDIKHVVIKRRS